MKTNENADMFRSVLKTLKQEARKGYKRSPEECLDILEKIIPLCGPFSRGKRVCREVGLWLLRGHTEIVAPVCPDYSHENGKYNFRTLNSGVPLLGEIHIQFLHVILNDWTITVYPPFPMSYLNTVEEQVLLLRLW